MTFFLLVGGKVTSDVSEILVIDLLIPTVRESTLTETAHTLAKHYSNHLRELFYDRRSW